MQNAIKMDRFICIFAMENGWAKVLFGVDKIVTCNSIYANVCNVRCTMCARVKVLATGKTGDRKITTRCI